MDFYYITTDNDLKQASIEWKKEKEIGIDLECENNLHHYGVYISLVQISSKNKHWIIDVIQVNNHKPLIQTLIDPNIQKIFHDLSFDLRVIQHQWQCYPKNIFDTQLAALFLGKNELSLGSLLEEYFNIQKERKFQKADWTKRPLSMEMLAYATKDSKYLIPLRDKLKNELKKKERFNWVKEELSYIEKKGFNYKQGTYIDLRGAKMLSDKEKSILKKLFALRESLAKKVDRPPYFVMNNKKLINLVKDPPISIDNWKRIHGVHPIVKKNAKEFFESVKDASQKVIKTQEIERKRMSGKQKKETHILNLKAETLGEKYHIKKHLILSKDQIRDIVLSKTFKSLRNWQKKLVQD